MLRLASLIFVFLVPAAVVRAGEDLEEWRKNSSRPAGKIEANTQVKDVKQEDDTLVMKKKLEHYNKRGMDYATKLFSIQDGSREDELRQKKSDALGYKLRFNTIEKTKVLLGKTKDARMTATLLKRLAELHEKQANSEQILYPTGPRAQAYKATMQKSIDIRNDLLRRYRPYINADIVLFSLAENYNMLGDTRRAEANYEEVTKFPKSIFIADAYLAMGNLRFDKKQFGNARNFYAKILEIKHTPLHAYAYYKIAWAYFNEQKEVLAMESLIDAIKTSRSMSKANRKRLDVEEEAVRDLVLFYSESGDPQKAKEFFAKVVDEEEAKEMRYMLARRYFSHDKHKEAFLVATELLNDSPADNYTGQLLMITLSISEKTKQRGSSVASAKRLAKWVLAMQDKLRGKPSAGAEADREELEAILGDAEESLRRLCHRLHFDAQKWNQKELWTLGKESYEIYLNTYKSGNELAEMRFRYSALLFKLRLNVEVYENTAILLGMIKPENPRFQEALKLRIQAIEGAAPEQRKTLDDKKLILAYDEFAKHFPKDPLAVEAMFKAANLAKKEEGPEKAAERFRLLAKNYPNHKLRDVAVKESLATLLAAGKWESLANESKLLMGVMTQSEGDKDDEKFLQNEVYKQLLNARNTALVKIAEEYEAQNKYEEAEKAYLDFINARKNSTLRPMALIKLASMSENKMQNYLEAIKYWEKIGTEYANTKEGQVADLEKARIHEKILQPKSAVVDYMRFAEKGKSKLHRTSLTNAAVILESVGEWNMAADAFLRLNEALKGQKDMVKESYQAIEYGCKNRLLAAVNPKDKGVYEKLADCASFLGKYQGGLEGVLWKVRAAWALEKTGRADAAIGLWREVASAKKLLTDKDQYSAFLALAKSRLLFPEYARYKAINFEKANENPNANIAKKSKALERVEAATVDIMKYGTPKQVELARRAMHAAYINFGETLEKSAMPKALPAADQEVLKKSFAEAARQMRQKAQEFVTVAEKGATEEEKAKEVEEKSYPSLSGKEFKELVLRAANDPKDAEAYARLAWHMFDKGEYGTARYAATKWESVLKKGASGGREFGDGALKQFWEQLGLKIPMQDPVVLELNSDAPITQSAAASDN